MSKKTNRQKQTARAKRNSRIKAAVIVVIAVAAGFLIPINLKHKVGYDELMKRTAVEAVYSTNATTSVSIQGDLQFTELSESVKSDLNTLYTHSGIKAEDGLDARIDLMSLSGNEWSGNYIHTKNVSNSVITSSQDKVATILSSILGEDPDTSSEILIERDTKKAILRTDNGEWNDISSYITEDDAKPLSTGDLVPALNFIAETVGKKKAVTLQTEGGYTTTFSFEINTELLDKVPQEYRDMAVKDFTSWENITSAVQILESNPGYHFPVNVTICFTGDGQYQITQIAISGDLSMEYQKTYEEILAMLSDKQEVLDNLPADYRFGVGGNIEISFDYRCDIGYDPNIQISIDNT